MLGKNAKVERLRRVPLFSACTKRELAEVAAIADEVSFPAGRVLIEEGARGREFIVILEGELDLRRGGRRLPLDPNANYFGEAALLTGAPRNATLKTVSTARALVITDRAFERLLDDQPGIQRKILASLAGRLADA